MIFDLCESAAERGQEGGRRYGHDGKPYQRAARANSLLSYKKGKCDRSSNSPLGSLPTEATSPQQCNELVS